MATPQWSPIMVSIVAALSQYVMISNRDLHIDRRDRKRHFLIYLNELQPNGWPWDEMAREKIICKYNNLKDTVSYSKIKSEHRGWIDYRRISCKSPIHVQYNGANTNMIGVLRFAYYQNETAVMLYNDYEYYAKNSITRTKVYFSTISAIQHGSLALLYGGIAGSLYGRALALSTAVLVSSSHLTRNFLLSIRDSDDLINVFLSGYLGGVAGAFTMRNSKCMHNMSAQSRRQYIHRSGGARTAIIFTITSFICQNYFFNRAVPSLTSDPPACKNKILMPNRWIAIPSPTLEMPSDAIKKHPIIRRGYIQSNYDTWKELPRANQFNHINEKEKNESYRGRRRSFEIDNLRILNSSSETHYGKGAFEAVNGDIYEGDHVGIELVGRGVYRFSLGDVYEGEFLHDMMTGKGVYCYINGDVYRGAFVDGKKTGLGSYKYANGDVYRGAFIDDHIVGEGVYSYANGDDDVRIYI